MLKATRDTLTRMLTRKLPPQSSFAAKNGVDGPSFSLLDSYRLTDPAHHAPSSNDGTHYGWPVLSMEWALILRSFRLLAWPSSQEARAR